MSSSADFLTTGGGKLYIKPIVLGVKQPMQYFGATDTVTLSSAVEYIEHKSTESRVAVTDKKVAKSRTATLNFTTGEISPEMLARAFQGEKVDVEQAEGTAVAKTLVGVKVGYIYDLGLVKITSIVVKNTDNATTYVEGTDYNYDKNTGYFELVEGGTITEASTINLTVNHGAYTKTNVAALMGSQLEAELVFISAPQAGQKYRYTFKKVSISATGDLALKSEEFATITFEGEALVDDSVTDPTLSSFFDMELLPND